MIIFIITHPNRHAAGIEGGDLPRGPRSQSRSEPNRPPTPSFRIPRRERGSRGARTWSRTAWTDGGHILSKIIGRPEEIQKERTAETCLITLKAVQELITCNGAHQEAK
ncbi:hypothetical protein QJS10_CPA10g01119 [Acorus calamus]|uniref:Uncharacterized protein n=1 Tax=Acorus calamus TaxID=4465 RepID=A0AAV9DZI5_ACOCL|nr:hypothetical protein QJS10_CPA10g01119 [Acorus calamus]